MVVTPEELAATLVERKRRDRAGYLAQAQQLRGRLPELVRALAPGQQAWLIVSLAWGEFGVGSDVDVVIAGLSAEAVTGLWDALTQQLRARVDVLRLEDLDATFRDRVLREGVALHVA